MVVMSNSSGSTINEETEEKIVPQSIVKTDGWRDFKHLKEVVNKHISQIVPPQEASKALLWVHTMIPNTKRNLL